jgi:hypothetical protein
MMYNAEIVAGSLLMNETRKLAEVMRDQSKAAWLDAVIAENVLQKTQSTAKRMAGLIRHRLETGDPDIWKLIVHGDFELSLQATLVLVIRRSRLLADFMSEVLGLKMRRLDFRLMQKDWDDFLQECELRDPIVAGWSELTKAKLSEVIVRILAEGRFLNSSKEKMIQGVMIRHEIRAYLDATNDQTTLASLELHR